MKLSILYRGPLSSCNYGCEYCPFAKHKETAAEHRADGEALNRFVAWVEAHPQHQISVFFTPWGEALPRVRYQKAIRRLTQMPSVKKVAIQTNLSCRLEWVDGCERSRLGIWATFHPSQISRERFVSKCLELDRRGVRFSVGAVGLKEQFEEIERLREELPRHIYVWVNAYKRAADYYHDADVERLEMVDPLFRTNTVRHPSFGMACRCGSSVISVDGDGTIRRCHFIRGVVGNIYEAGWESALGMPQPCTNETCGCHIGYVHLEHLGLETVYGDGILERIPKD